jgi:hypothetical protein|tara:strand:+ start:855 stop:1100 length:246 start_codon:yes stop_codon:yes gene_type:complete
MSDPVSQPSHYQNDGDSLECFPAFVAMRGRDAGVIAALFNVHKYCYRFDKKHNELGRQIEDLQKAKQYLNFAIKLLSDAES